MGYKVCPSCGSYSHFHINSCLCEECFPITENFHRDEEEDYNLATCGGCGAYGKLGNTHSRKGKECGQFV